MSGEETVGLTELWRIGGDTDDDAEFFGVLSQITTDEAGNVYLLDRQLTEVKVFSPDGEYLNTIGREGEGPGEFRRPSDLFITPRRPRRRHADGPGQDRPLHDGRRPGR